MLIQGAGLRRNKPPVLAHRREEIHQRLDARALPSAEPLFCRQDERTSTAL